MAIDLSKYKKTGSGTIDLEKYKVAPAVPQSRTTLPKPSVGQRVLDAGTKVAGALGFKGTADYIGTNLAQIANAVSPLRKDTTVAQAAERSRAIGQTNLKQSVGAGFQLGSVVAGGTSSAAAPLVRAIPAAAASGAAALGGKAAADDKSAGVVARDAAIGAALGAGFEGAGRALQSVARTAYRVAIPKSKKEAIMIQNYRANKPFIERIKDAATGDAMPPRIVADTAFDKGITGFESMMGVQAKRAQKNIWKGMIKPQLDASKDEIVMTDFFRQARRSIIAENQELTRRNALLTALDAIEADYKDVPTVSTLRLQRLKEGWAKFVPEKVYRGENVAGAVNDVRNTLAAQARTRIYEGIGDPAIRQAYIDYGNLHGLAALGQKAMTNAGLKGGTGQLVSSLLERTIVPIATVAGQTMYKVGSGIELVGRPGLSTLGEFIDSLTNEQPKTPRTPPTQPQARTETSSLPKRTIPGVSVNERGGITVKGPFSGKDFELDVMGAGTTKKAATVALKGAQTYAKEAKSLVSKGLSSETLRAVEGAYAVLWRGHRVPEGFTKAQLLTATRNALEKAGVKNVFDWTDAKVTRFVEAVKMEIFKRDRKWDTTID